MRTIRLLSLLLLLASFAVAQQKDAKKKPAEKKSPAAEKSVTPEATQPHPEDTRAIESQANAPAPPSSLTPTLNTKFDMKEVLPVVTHHSIKAATGKTLQYTATTGRMPIKDAVGNIEAEMF